MHAGGRRFDPGQLHHVILLIFARNSPGWGNSIKLIFDNLGNVFLVLIKLRTRHDFALTKLYGQVIKSIWWMPWRREAMKDVASCDKLRGVAKQTLIRRFPNGETHLDEVELSSSEYIG